MDIIVLFYSRYSDACTRLMKIMHSCVEYRKICIDNDNVRRLIVSDPFQYEIQNVPCILVFYPDGNMKKYEGSKAFDYIHQLLKEVQEEFTTTTTTTAPWTSLHPLPPSVNSTDEVITNPPTEEEEEEPDDMEKMMTKMDKRKTKDLMSMAQQMEKQREAEDQLRNQQLTQQEPPPSRPV